MYLSGGNWLEYGPRAPRKAGFRGRVRGMRGLGDGEITMPCLNGAGPLQPGQDYCVPITVTGNDPLPPAITPASSPFGTGIMQTIQQNAVPIAVGVAVLFGLNLAFGKRR